MARLEFHNVGALGVIKDRPAHTLPPEAWSDGRNIRFRDNSAVKITGHANVFGTLSGTPYWNMACPDPSNAFWIYGSLTKMYATDGTSHADITRTVGGDYGTVLDRLWNGGILSGVPVITNGVDVPQFWASPGLASDLAALTNWPANNVCRVIRPFKAFLVALYITKAGTVYPHRVKWSHPADPGTVPVSWDETDPTKDAGEFDLDGAGSIVSGLRLRNAFVIYKERSTWLMQYIGGQYIFRFDELFESTGILGVHCVASFNDGAKHFVATGEDVIVHNGQELDSVLDQKWRRWLSRNIDSTYAKRSFVVENPIEHEMWFCFPEVGATAPTLAVAWNSHSGTVGVRELAGGIPFIAKGQIPGSGGGTWNSDSATWDSDTSTWDEQTFAGYQARLLQANPADIKLQQIDSGETFNGSNMTAYLQREDHAFDGQDRQGNPKAGFTKRKLIKRIWPKMIGSSVNWRVGTKENLDDAIVWGPTKSFNPATQKYFDVMQGGRLISLRVESNSDQSWELQGYDMEYELLGEL